MNRKISALRIVTLTVLASLLLISAACIRIVPSSPMATTPTSPSTSTPVQSINNLPIAYIDAILPALAAAGSTITFSGHGIDNGGTIVSYEWRSNLEGFLSNQQSFTSNTLSTGTHMIYFKVKDNASQWSAETSGTVVITPKIVNKPTIHTFSAAPSSIMAGGAAILNWSVNGANTVTIDNGIGTVSPSGTKTIYPSRSTYYTMTAINEGGITTATVLVDVYNVPQQNYGYPIIEYFTPVSYGTYVRITWSVVNATSVYIDNGIGYVSATGHRDISTPGTYTLTATNPYGQNYATINIYSY